ncbi:MAG TPA: sugar-binding protein [Armatimonadota bacterium]
MKLRFVLALGCAMALNLGTCWAAASYEKAIYFDAAQTVGWEGGSASAIHDYFVTAGYTDLDATSLKAWMDARIKDMTPSVVVLAQDNWPSTVVEVDANGIITSGPTTFRKYLDAGGKIVHLADIPGYNISVDGTNLNPQPGGNGAQIVLGVNVTDKWDENVEAVITPEGKKWGLTQTWTTVRAMDPKKADVVLATNQDGSYASAWVRRYALMPSSGFVRLWDWNMDGGKATEEVLKDIQNVAEYAMSGVTGIGTISGTVKDGTGKAIPGVTVKLTAAFGSATITADSAGKFTLVAAAGDVTGAASGAASDSGAPVKSSDTPKVTVAAGQRASMTITATLDQPFVYNIVRAKAPIKIDGVGDDAAWADGTPMLLNTKEQVNAGTWGGVDDLSAIVKVMFDDQYLYVLADVTDDHPRINSHGPDDAGNVWQGDGVETYVGLDGFDPKRGTYDKTRNYQWSTGAGPDPAWKIYRPDPGDVLPPNIPGTDGNLVIKDHAAGQKPGYVVEERMPWTGFPDADKTLIPPKDNAPASLTVALNDTDTADGTTRDKGMIFQYTTDAYRYANTWVRGVWNSPTTVTPTVTLGDLNGDSKVSITDVVTALRGVAGLVTLTADQQKAADVNADGKFNITDVVLMLRYVAGLITKFPGQA